jgi:hypothetical protein
MKPITRKNTATHYSYILVFSLKITGVNPTLGIHVD